MDSANRKMTGKHLIIVAFVAFFAGCGGSKEAAKPSPGTASGEGRLLEEAFRPADYDMEVKKFFSDLRKEQAKKSVAAETVALEPPVLVQGYRVQILATNQIDEANAKRAEAELLFPGMWFYVAYDPPSYKVRAGNFLQRADADAYVRQLSVSGYPDAWIVPDKVIKNPQPRHAQQDPPKQ